MNFQTRQKGVIPLAIVAVGFLVTSLIGVVVTTNDTARNFALNSFASKKNWRDIGNPRARQAARSAEEADNAQAQAVQQVCPGGCTAEQLQNAGIEVTAGQNPSGFYYNEQSGSYYPIAASAGGGYGASELQQIGAAQQPAADDGDVEEEAPEVDNSDLSLNDQFGGEPGFAGDASLPDQTGGTSGQTGLSVTGSAGGGSSDVDTYGGDINTLFGQTNFGLTQSGDEINLGAVIDPIIGPNTNIGVNIDDNQVSVGVQNPILDTAGDVAQTGAIVAAQVAFAPAINAYNSAVDTYNAYVTFNNIVNTVESVVAGVSNILGNIFGQ